MKLLKCLVVLALFVGTSQVRAEEKVGEKVKDKVHDIKRDVKADAHRAEEKACDKNDKKTYADCMAKKASNRTNEAGSAVKDKASEVKNKVD